MSTMSQEEIQEIIERVRRRLGEAGEQPGVGLRAHDALSAAAEAELGEGIFPTIGEAVQAASRAYVDYQRIGLEGRKAIVASIRASMLEHAESLAEMAVAETGLGRVADKIVKNRLVTAKTPGPGGPRAGGGHGRRGDDGHRVRAVRRRRRDHADHEPHVDGHQQHDRDRLRGELACVQRASEREARVGGEHPPRQPRDRRRRRAREPGHGRCPSRRSTAPRS